jgi:raffinose/stachyose/melibiose transport system permease protein
MHVFCKRWIKLLFLLPTLVFFCTWTVFPVYSMFKTSFEYNRLGMGGAFKPKPNGIANYKWVATDPRLPKVFANTLVTTVGDLVILVPFAFLLGLLLNKDFRGNGVMKLISFAPYIISGVLTSLVWFFVIDPRIGVLNAALKQVGLGNLALQWIGGETLTPYTVAVLDSWKAIGFYAVLMLAGLKMIPAELYEAAIIDGASAPRRTWNITIPLLKETFKICIVYVIIGGIQTFQTIYILTSGGPNYKSHEIATFIYFEEWSARDMGRGCALSVVMFVIIMGLSIGFLVATRKRVEA